MKEILQKILPKRIYSFLVRFSKIPLAIYATSNIKKTKNTPSEKKILIVKTDAIGDYVMFRNFIKEIKKSKKYKGYKVYLLGNTIWKNIFDKLDSSEVDKAYFINRKLLYNKKYIGEIIEKLNKENFKLILHPVCHREFAIDYFIKKIKSKEKIGHFKVGMNQGNLEKFFSDRFYTKLIKTDQEFEFDKNKNLFEQVLREKINLLNPKINIKKKRGNYFVINPGVSVEFRKWKPENFAKVIDYLIEKYKAKIYIVGSKSELDLDNKVRNLSKYKNKIKIKSGDTLFEVLALIAGSRGVISNETCTHHMAVALDKKIYCIVTGIGHIITYPYPNYKKAIYFYPNSFDKKNPTLDILDINETSPEDVIKKINF